MRYPLRLPLLGVILFCLTSMAGCPNTEPAGQFTVVQGALVNLRTSQPLANVRMALVSNGQRPGGYYFIEDTVRTDAQGKYALSFSNKKGLYYGISCEGPTDDARPFRLDLPDSTDKYSSLYNLRTVNLVLGRTNTVNFRPSPRRVWRVQLATRATGYQRLRFDWRQSLPADNQAQLVWLYLAVPYSKGFPQDLYNKPSTAPQAIFSRTLASSITQDTTVQVQASMPLTGDTVRATLTFGR
jgi:hypothetical protein